MSDNHYAASSSVHSAIGSRVPPALPYKFGDITRTGWYVSRARKLSELTHGSDPLVVRAELFSPYSGEGGVLYRATNRADSLPGQGIMNPRRTHLSSVVHGNQGSAYLIQDQRYKQDTQKFEIPADAFRALSKYIDEFNVKLREIFDISVVSHATKTKIDVSYPKVIPSVSYRPNIQFADTDPPELADALQDLDEICEEAEENGYVPPSVSTIRHADTVLRRLYKAYPRLYIVYSMPDDEIGIYAPGKEGESAVLYCFPDGSTHCHVNMQGSVTRTECQTIDRLFDPPLRKVFEQLKRNREMDQCQGSS